MQNAEQGFSGSSKRSLLRGAPPQEVVQWCVDTIKGLISEQKFAEARLVLHILVRFDPKNIDAIHLLGSVAYEQGLFEEAIEAFNETVHLAPEHEEALYNLGFSYYRLKDLDTAEHCFERLVTIVNPKHDRGWLELSVLRQEKGDYIGELSAIEGLLRIQPMHPGLGRYVIFSRLYGRFLELVDFFEEQIKNYPDYPRVVTEFTVSQGDMKFNEGLYDQAFSFYDKACGMLPGLGYSFNWKTITALRCIGVTRDANLEKVEQKSSQIFGSYVTGSSGRFGDTLFQYIFQKLYAKKHKLKLVGPEWFGHYLFQIKDPLLTGDFLSGGASVEEWKESLLSPEGQPIWGQVDSSITVKITSSLAFCGYLDCEENLSFIRELLTPVDQVRKSVEAAEAVLRSKGNTLLVIHIRRGDYNYDRKHLLSPESIYLEWLERIWPTLEKPVLYIASDDPLTVKDRFSQYSPYTLEDMPKPFTGLEFYTDFYLLTKADRLAISLSSFSRLAAILNKDAVEIMRPDLKSEKLFSVKGAIAISEPFYQ